MMKADSVQSVWCLRMPYTDTVFPAYHSAAKSILTFQTEKKEETSSMAWHFLLALIGTQELYILKTSTHLRISDCIPPSTSEKEHSNWAVFTNHFFNLLQIRNRR